MIAVRRYRDWAILLAAGTAALAGLIWMGLALFPLMSWDVYETGRLFIVAFLAAVLATVFGNVRAYAKGKADGYQHGHDVGWQAGWEAAGTNGGLWFQPKNPQTYIPPLGFPHAESRIYTTE